MGYDSGWDIDNRRYLDRWFVFDIAFSSDLTAVRAVPPCLQGYGIDCSTEGCKICGVMNTVLQ